MIDYRKIGERVVKLTVPIERHRNIRRLFNETATRVELNVVETLCEYLKIEAGDLYEIPKKILRRKKKIRICAALKSGPLFI